MRAPVGDVRNPYPMGRYLPSMLQQDDFAQRFTGALDEVLGPLISTLANVDTYLDPALAPADFVEWLATWVGLELDENWPLERRRALVAQAMDLYRWRGTRRGIAAHVALYTGVEPEIEDSGGVAWSAAPGAPFPGSSAPTMVVRIRVDDPEEIDEARLDRLITMSKPAHVRHELEVLTT